VVADRLARDRQTLRPRYDLAAMDTPFTKLAARRAHLDSGNLLRSLTDVINRVEGGINLGQGVCDMDTPVPLVRGATASIEGGDRQLYTPYAGLPELRAQVAKKLSEWNGLPFGMENVAITTGSSGAFFAAGTTLLEPGDEVVVFEPFYPYHWSNLKLLGAVPKSVRLAGPELRFDAEALRRALTPRTRAIVVNTPANPSGKIFTRDELVELGRALAGTSILVLTDEVYEHMCFDGREHVSPGTVPGLADRTLTIGGYSKTFSITGWRIGYVAGPADTIDAIGRVFDQINVCAPRPLQRGVQKALEELPASFYAELQRTYQAKRDRFCAALEKAGFRFRRPEGAYYVLADYTELFGDVDSHVAVLKMIERLRINGVPGKVFHADPAGVRTIRFQFAVMPAVLEEVCRRLEGAR
jgi:aminotransferase